MGKIGIDITTGTLQKKVQNDIPVNVLAEAQMEAQQLLDNATLFMMKNRSFLTSDEVVATNSAVKDLSAKMKSGSKDEIYTSIEILNEIFRRYAERLR